MSIKKWNAQLALLTFILLLIHEAYQLFAYITFYYNPILSKVTAYAVAGCFALHAILSIVIVFAMHDSKSVAYKKLNLRLVIQRVSAAAMILLLPLHILSFGLLQISVGGAGYVLIEIAQILFYAAMFTHIATSFTSSLITLGRLEDMRKKQIIDRVMIVICALLFIAVSVVITVTHTMIFQV